MRAVENILVNPVRIGECQMYTIDHHTLPSSWKCAVC
jgi:hypothetical protein